MNTQPLRKRGQTLTAADGLFSGAGLFARIGARAPDALFHRMLDRIDIGLAAGSIEGHLPDGSVRLLGGRGDGPMAVVHLKSWAALVRLALSGSVGWYRAWERGEWSSPDPVPLFDLFMRNAVTLGQSARARGPWRWLGRAMHGLRRNSRAGSRRNILAHYDLGNDFYRQWLDANMVYSSALFTEAGQSLEQAQMQKLDAILDRLDLHSGGTLLEIGCGWGALGRRAIERHDVRYTGITLSDEQVAAVAASLSAMGGDASGSRALICDYRDVTGTYDAIASVEMVEAVGQRYWPDFMATVAARLRTGGRAAIQFITIDDALFDAYVQSADFIQAYIFPGGCLISERHFRALAAAQGLDWTDVNVFGADYAETLKQWRVRFDAAVAANRLPAGFDERFVALWRYYLMYCEGGFRGGGINVMQVTLTKTA